MQKCAEEEFEEIWVMKQNQTIEKNQLTSASSCLRIVKCLFRSSSKSGIRVLRDFIVAAKSKLVLLRRGLNSCPLSSNANPSFCSLTIALGMDGNLDVNIHNLCWFLFEITFASHGCLNVICPPVCPIAEDSISGSDGHFDRVLSCPRF